MTWQAYAIIIWFVLNMIMSIGFIGRKVELTRFGAVLNLFIYSFLIWCVTTLVN